MTAAQKLIKLLRDLKKHIGRDLTVEEIISINNYMLTHEVEPIAASESIADLLEGEITREEIFKLL